MARKLENSPTSPVMLKKRGPREYDAKADPTFSWIERPTGDAWKDLFSLTQRLLNFNQFRLWANTRFMSLYCNEDFLQPYNGSNSTSGGSGVGGNGTQNRRRMAMPRQSANYIKAYTDTLAGKLIQSNSRVQASTILGDWKTWRLSRKLDRMLDAEFVKGHLWRECSRVVVDTLNTGTGYLYIGEENGQVCYERWYPNELFFDPLDAAYGAPSVMFRIRYMKRDNLLATFGNTAEKADIIRRAATAPAPAFVWAPYQSGMVMVVESWALPVGTRKGRHVICLSTGSLRDEPWTDECFPVAIFKAGDFPLGVHGQGFIAHAGAAQTMLNHILNIMAKSAHLGFAPYWTVSGNAEISLKQLNNDEGHIVSSTGPEPKWNANKPFHEAAPAYVEMLASIIRMIYGVNDMEAAGSMPLNRLDSDPALVQAQDIWAARHTILLKNWSEDFFMDVAHRTIDVARRIAKDKGSYPVVATKAGRAWGMDWKDFTELEKQSYRLHLATQSALPLTASARKKMALELRDAGILSPERAAQMVMGGDADLEAATADIAAFENNAEWLIEQLYEGKYPTLSGMQKPDIVLARVRSAGLQAFEYGAPAEVISNFETFTAQLMTMSAAAQQMAQAAMQPPQAAPGGAPPNTQPNPLIPGGTTL